jgi:hypothetical protein
MERWSASTLWPSYIGEKGRTLGKTYEIKARCYWESREHVENKEKMTPPQKQQQQQHDRQRQQRRRPRKHEFTNRQHEEECVCATDTDAAYNW